MNKSEKVVRAALQELQEHREILIRISRDGHYYSLALLLHYPGINLGITQAFQSGAVKVRKSEVDLDPDPEPQPTPVDSTEVEAISGVTSGGTSAHTSAESAEVSDASTFKDNGLNASKKPSQEAVKEDSKEGRFVRERSSLTPKESLSTSLYAKADVDEGKTGQPCGGALPAPPVTPLAGKVEAMQRRVEREGSLCALLQNMETYEQPWLYQFYRGADVMGWIVDDKDPLLGAKFAQEFAKSWDECEPSVTRVCFMERLVERCIHDGTIFPPCFRKHKDSLRRSGDTLSIDEAIQKADEEEQD